MTGWAIGWILGGIVVVLVVVLLLLMIRGAARAGAKAGNVLAALVTARDNTAPLWAVDTTNRTVDRITAAATAAREHLASQASQANTGG